MQIIPAFLRPSLPFDVAITHETENEYLHTHKNKNRKTYVKYKIAYKLQN